MSPATAAPGLDPLGDGDHAADVTEGAGSPLHVMKKYRDRSGTSI
jgi:hypothetical protein